MNLKELPIVQVPINGVVAACTGNCGCGTHQGQGA